MLERKKESNKQTKIEIEKRKEKEMRKNWISKILNKKKEKQINVKTYNLKNIK